MKRSKKIKLKQIIFQEVNFSVFAIFQKSKKWSKSNLKTLKHPRYKFNVVFPSKKHLLAKIISGWVCKQISRFDIKTFKPKPNSSEIVWWFLYLIFHFKTEKSLRATISSYVVTAIFDSMQLNNFPSANCLQNVFNVYVVISWSWRHTQKLAADRGYR